MVLSVISENLIPGHDYNSKLNYLIFPKGISSYNLNIKLLSLYYIKNGHRVLFLDIHCVSVFLRKNEAS